MTTIRVLGTGCPTCKRLYSDVQAYVKQNHTTADVEYVTDIEKIMGYGVMRTPALMVDDKVIAVGHPGIPKLAKLLQESIA